MQPVAISSPALTDTARTSCRPRGVSDRVGWTSLAIVFASACITFGILWDISWHTTIGRDTFWTPAHMMIYLGGTLGGFLAGWLAFEATMLRRENLRGLTVGLWFARAPLGAWVCIWGATAMLVSAPFDDWWHSAYGLDVKILSPPHAILALGMYGVVTGALFLVAAERNRLAAETTTAGSPWLVIVANGLQLALGSILLTEVSFPNLQHTGVFLKASCVLYPAFLVAAAQHGAMRWSATRVALVYTAVMCALIWVLPLFPAEPKLAPIYSRLDHMAPPAFPLLLVVPAFALDLLFLTLRNRRGWRWNLLRLVAAATLFVALFMPAQWFFARFLISTAADNWFFAGGHFFSYMSRDGQWRHEFWQLSQDPLNFRAIIVAWVIAQGSAAFGLGAGNFLARIRR